MSNDTKWGDTNNPEAHDSQKFRYLVHAFNPFAGASMGLINANMLYQNSKMVKTIELTLLMVTKPSIYMNNQSE